MAKELEIAAIGRPFKLGLPYDCCRERLLDGPTFWSKTALKKHSISESQESIKFDIIENGDTIRDKANIIGLAPNATLSLLADTVEITGSTKFFSDRKTSKHQSRIIIKYEYRTKLEKLKLEEVRKETVELNGESKATHVVVRIRYGCIALFVFDKSNYDKHTNDNTRSSLKTLMNKFCSVAKDLNAEHGLVLTDEQKHLADSLEIQVYSDIVPPTYPTTFAECVQLCQRFPHIGNKLAEPIRVWLYPISSLSNNFETLPWEISHSKIRKIEEMFMNLEKYVTACEDLERASHEVLPMLSNEAKRLKDFIEVYKCMMQGHLKYEVPLIRGGIIPDSNIDEAYAEWNKSPLNENHMMKWFGKKKEELKILRQQIQKMYGVQYVSSAEDFDHWNDSDTIFLVCFTILKQKTDHYLELVKAYIETKEYKRNVDIEVSQFRNDKSSDKVLLTLGRMFMNFFEHNKHSSKTKFVVTVEETDTEEPGACIRLYKEMELINKNFTPPSEPQNLAAKHITHESVTLSWGKPNDGNENITKYEINCTDGDSEDSNEMKPNVQVFSLHGLKSETTYRIQIRACSEVGVSQYAVFPGTITTKVIKVVETKPVRINPLDRLRITAESDLLLRQGPPAVYQLPWECNDGIEIIQKRIIGVDNNKGIPEKVILMVGATGTGKTTLINGIVNYICDIKWEDDIRFKPIVELGEENQAISQTRDITCYTLYHREGFNIPYTLTVIDTPGFGDDTSSDNTDKETVAKINKLFESKDSGVDHISAVGFVVPGSQPRLTESQRYIFDSVLALFGKDIENNIFILVTFVDNTSKDPQVLHSIKEAGLPYREFFSYNNSVIFDANQQGINAPNEIIWNQTEKSYKLLLQRINQIDDKSLTLSKKVLDARIKLQTYIQGIHEDIEDGMIKCRQLQEENLVLEKHKEDIENNKHFEYFVPITVRVEEPLIDEAFAMNCTKCKRTCHHPCWVRNDIKILNYTCAAVYWDGKCRVCHCNYDTHKPEEFKYIFKEEEEKRTDEDLKERYEAAEGKKCLLCN